MLRVGIIGVGTVGTSVANILIDNKNIITARAGKEIVPTIGVVSNLDKKRDVSIKLTTNPDEILEDDSIDIVVELMGVYCWLFLLTLCLTGLPDKLYANSMVNPVKSF